MPKRRKNKRTAPKEDGGQGEKSQPEDVEMDGGGASGGPVIAMQSSPITDIKGWSTGTMAQWIKLVGPEETPWTKVSLENIGDVDDLKEAIKRKSVPLLDNYAPAQLILKAKKHTDSDEQAVELGNPRESMASVHQHFGSDCEVLVSVPDGPSLKKQFLNKPTLKDAVEQANLTNKAVVNDRVDLSLLNKKERVTVLGFLGQEVQSRLEPFTILFETACALQEKHNSGEQFPKIISPPSPNMKLPVVYTKLYVRDSYKDLYSHITRSFKDMPPTYRQNLLLITGTSGIGKSAFLVYFTIRLIAESTANNPPIIIFHTNESSICYAFGGTLTLRVGNITDFGHFLELSETWYLVDSSPKPVTKGAKTLIAVSPKTLSSEDKHYQEISKLLPSIYYMAPWELDELENCRLGVFPAVQQNLMERLYAKMGGVPRYVLQASEKEFFRDPNVATAEDQAFYRVRRAIDEVKDASKLLEYIGQAKDFLEFSSRLLHRWPNEDDHRKYHLKWASTHIQEEIEKKLIDQTWGELLKKLVREGQYTARGPLFELYVIHIFRKGGYTFDIKELEGNLSSSHHQILPNPPVKLFKSSTELSTPTNGTLFLPTIPNFPCVDLFLAPSDLFQVTVSSTHPIKQHKLKEIAENILGDSNRELRLFFVVPADIYDGFGKQNYILESGGVSQRIPSKVRDNVKQYALKFDITAASNGQSPGVGNGLPY